MIIRINTFLQKLLTTSTSYKLGLRNFLHCAWPRRDWLHSPWLKRKLSNVYLSILAYMCVCVHVCFACVGVYVFMCAIFVTISVAQPSPERPKRKTLLLNFSAFGALKFICSTTTWQIVYQCHFHSMSIKRLQCNLFFIPSAEKLPN